MFGGKHWPPVTDMDSTGVLSEERWLFKEACGTGDITTVRELCDRHHGLVWQVLENCGSKFDGQGTGLHLAACEGHVDCCQVLVDAGADIEAKHGQGRTPLMHASDTDCAVLELLLKSRAEVNAVDHQGWTALHVCANHKWNIRAVQLLVSAGADMEIKNFHGKTPLTVAMDIGNLSVAVELIKLDKMGVNRKVNSLKETLLHVISRLHFEPSARFHIQALVAAGADLEAVDCLLRTPLITAASHCNANACLQLLELGADINARDRNNASPELAASDYKIPAMIAACRIERDAGLSLGTRQGEAWPPTRVHLLLASAECGFEQAVRKLVENGADLEAQNADSNTAFVLASKNGHSGIVRYLAEAGARVDVSNKEGQGAYLLALGNGHPATASELFTMGVGTNGCDKEGNTSLHLSALNGYTELVCKEVNRSGGAVVGRCNCEGNMPLHLAAERNQTETVRALIYLGADMEAPGKCGYTALHVATRWGYAQTVKELLKLGANIEARDEDGNTALLLAFKHGHTQTAVVLVQARANVQVEDSNGDSPLIFASRLENTQVVRKLLEAGASPSASNREGSSALLVACKYGRLSTAKTLIAAGADPQTSDPDGNTPLLHALQNVSIGLASELIAAGADVGVRNCAGVTALALASTRGLGELCCQLIEHGAVVDQGTSFFLCLDYAVRNGDLQTLARLFQVGVSINERGRGGLTALHMAIGYNIETVRWLLDQGADLFAKTDDGYTPLHTACTGSQSDAQSLVIKLLLKRGANPTAVSNDSKTPLNLAEERRFYLAIAILRSAEVAHHLVQLGGKATQPTAVAVRFGGPPGAGKSTLTKALRVKRLRSLFRKESRADEGADNLQKRTKGINCKTFRDANSSQFTIFDLGGHGEFLATHQIFIGDGSVPVIDCVIVSALDCSLEEQALKWCSLFASRNQPTETPWPLLLIATRADKATEEQRRAVWNAFRKIQELFENYFCFPLNEPLFIDARKSWGDLTVILRNALSRLHSRLISNDDSPQQPAISQGMINFLPALRKKTSAPVVTKDEFIEFMRPRIGLESSELSTDQSLPSLKSLFAKALQYLTGYASVLSFRQANLQNLVVIDPPWLLSDIVGRLMVEPPLPGPYINYDNGYAKRADVIAALETKYLPGETAFKMAAGLGFCLEQKQLQKVLNPSKLRSTRAPKHWRLDATMAVNAGRRLKVKGIVAISNAFFPHLQVHFYHRYLTEYDEELPLWNGGIRLVAGERTPAEALIEAHPAHMSIDIIVRGKSGTERACTELLHDLTEETLRKAVEISPGSQLGVFYLSRLELDQLSPAGLVSRPCVEYSAERVERAIRHGKFVTDGNASSPENPFDLLLSAQALEQLTTPEDSSLPASDTVVQAISDEDWRVILLNLAKAVNNVDQCNILAKCLAVNDREGDLVEQLLSINPHRSPPEIATVIYHRWLQRAEGQTTESRRATLHRVFRVELRRPLLCAFLEDELKSVTCFKEDQTHRKPSDGRTSRPVSYI